MTKPRILITNDDGIHAPGIKYLWNALKDIAEIV
ncbi:MAG TPA: 5'/3'-nucleotidase SurE, partial [Waddliaceae bacterium]